VVSADLAKKAGFAWIDAEAKFNVIEISGSVVEQADFCISITQPGELVIIEDFVYFAKSVKTQASLLKRLGVFEFILGGAGREIKLANVNSVRAKFFKGRQKKQQVLEHFRINVNDLLTDNHTDALLMLLYGLDLDINSVNKENLIINA